MEYRRYDIAVGVFFVLTFFGLFFLSTMAMRGVPLWGGRASYYDVTAVFDDVGQLNVGAPVKSAGVLVGRVVGVDLDLKTYKAVVSMRLNGRYHFPVDSTASIITASFFGAPFVSVEAGLDSNMLRGGGRIFHTQPAWILEKLISRFFIEHINTK